MAWHVQLASMACPWALHVDGDAAGDAKRNPHPQKSASRLGHLTVVPTGCGPSPSSPATAPLLGPQACFHPHRQSTRLSTQHSLLGILPSPSISAPPISRAPGVGISGSFSCVAASWHAVQPANPTDDRTAGGAPKSESYPRHPRHPRHPRLSRYSNTSHGRWQIGLCHAREAARRERGISLLMDTQPINHPIGSKPQTPSLQTSIGADRRRPIPCRLLDPTPAAELPLSACRRR